jgi:hypothetical protein
LNQRTELGIDVTTGKMCGLKLGVGVELIDGFSKGLKVPNRLADRCLSVGLQHVFNGGGDDGHSVQRDVVLVDQLQIGPRATAVPWWRDPFASKTG